MTKEEYEEFYSDAVEVLYMLYDTIEILILGGEEVNGNVLGILQAPIGLLGKKHGIDFGPDAKVR